MPRHGGDEVLLASGPPAFPRHSGDEAAGTKVAWDMRRRARGDWILVAISSKVNHHEASLRRDRILAAVSSEVNYQKSAC
jgi:hypothetical protein